MRMPTVPGVCFQSAMTSAAAESSGSTPAGNSLMSSAINEAFAAIVIVVVRELGLPEDIFNVEGSAIAHGHPIGATGAVLTTRLIHSMRRDGLKRGIVTLCIGAPSWGGCVAKADVASSGFLVDFLP